ncbi:hypothetical protein FA95DRAFT_1533918 [Auriscalpium vulgare]|uniref:Uncharacterized protein n=1 Tax=Auriscalpium vulgare TaxID=40419 RepID=A0ACB8S5K9_9AGAM|nr:hypothetical protein FA95DRAFT_1533918 [Auriscalpium vulgare]
MADRTHLARKAKAKQPERDLLANTRSYLWGALTAPVRLAFALLGLAVRPVAAQLIPAAVLLFLIPLLIAPALFAGIYVWTSVPTGWTQPLYLVYGDGQPPYAEVPLSDISVVHPYDISLHLDVPATDANYALGNFMTSLTLVGSSNRTIKSVRRPAIVLPSKALLWTRRSVVPLDIRFLSAFTPGTRIVSARVELGRRDGWRSLGSGEGRELSVLAASLHGVVLHRGLRGLVSRYPLISALTAATTFLIVSALVLAACLLPSFRWRYDDDEKAPPSPVKSERDLIKKPSQEVLGEKSARRRRSFKRSQSQEPEIAMADIPFAESTSAPLRRRRSKLSERQSDSE